MSGMEEKGAFDWAFPAIFEGDPTDRNSVAPVGAARGNGRHTAAAYE